jgi:hypothetical protein
MVSVARATHLHSIVLIHGAADWAELLNQQLQKYSQQHADSFCLAGIYALHRKNTKEPTGTINSSKLMVTDDIIRTLKPGTMAVLLLEDPEEMRVFMEVCQYISGLVFLTVFHPWNTNSYAGKYICTTFINVFSSFFWEKYFMSISQITCVLYQLLSDLLLLQNKMRIYKPKWYGMYQVAFHIKEILRRT